MDNIDFTKVGKEMKRLRASHGYTQEKVADDLGCTIAFVSNVENNRAKLNLRVLMYYSKLCNVSIDSILNAGKEASDKKNISDIRDSELIGVFHQYSEEEQEKILHILKYIKKDADN